MKNSNIAIAILLLLVCMGTKAQNSSRSLTVSYSPLGYNHVNISLKNEEYKYDYKSYWNVNLGFEKQFKGIVSLTEITYSYAKFDKYKLKGMSDFFNPAQEEDLKTASITTYAGRTFNRNRRLQIPVYIGIGCDYLYGGPIHNLAVDLALKARIKYYVTNNIGVLVGVTGRVGLGTKNAKDGDKTKKELYTLVPSMWAVDAGLIFGI